MTILHLVSIVCAPMLFCGTCLAATYFVSPTGDDGHDGLSPEKAWKTVAKVNGFQFAPGDSILFQRGGEWRESLIASSDGSADSPITYDAFGEGAKPILWGSEKLDNAEFTPAGDGKWAYAIATQADSALVDHVFVPSRWENGVLTIESPGDPRASGKFYTACVRGNVLFSNRKNHLVFKNFVVDETAGELNVGINQGYGVRIEGSTDVLVESVEVYRSGRHHFGVINSTGFVGRHLKAAYVVPKMPGGNSAYVSYADGGAPVEQCTSVWDDIQSDHLEDPGGGRNTPFVSHGKRQGLIVVQNSTLNGKFSFMSAPVIVRNCTLTRNASIENWGEGALIDGVKILDSAAIDQYGSGGTIQNCVVNLTPTGSGPTGYSAAIVFREPSKRNVVRFNTLVCGKFSGLMLVGNESATTLYGNIVLSDTAVLSKPNATITPADVAHADLNFYNPRAMFGKLSLTEWQQLGFDKRSRSGDPMFADLAAGDLSLKPDSPARGAGPVVAPELPADGPNGQKRDPQNVDLGAIPAAAK